MPFLHDPEYPHRNAQSHTVKRLLGLLTTEKLPAEGMPPRIIQGIEVWVEPLRPPRLYRSRRGCMHRVMAKCPVCGQILSAGRLHQHVCKTNP